MPAYDGPHPPGRPSVPPVFWALVSALFAAQSVLRMQLGSKRCIDAIVILMLSAFALASILALWGKGPQARFVLVIAATASVVALSSSMVVDISRSAVSDLESSAVSEWSFLVTGDARFSRGRYRMRARARKAGSVSSDVWLYSDERLFPGTTVVGVGRSKALDEGSWSVASHAQGINAQVSILKIESLTKRGGPLGMLDALRGRAIVSIRPASNVARALLAACTVGDRTGIDELGFEDVLRRCGISHLVAVSGTHLALVASACTMLLDRLSLHPRARAAALGCVTGAFVLLCGAPPSAVRAWLMVLAYIAGQMVGRRGHGTSSLSCAAIAMALMDPPVTGQLAYQLSVAAVLGIRIVYPYLRYAIDVVFSMRRHGRRWAASLDERLKPLFYSMRDLTAMTLTAQLVTLPITAEAFGELSLIAPLTNLIATPPISLLTIAGLASIALLPVPHASEILIVACTPLGEALMKLLSFMSGFRWASVPVGSHVSLIGSSILVFVLMLAWFSPRITRRAVLISVIATISILAIWYGSNRFLAPARICMLDVGQGDAILIQVGPHAVLVDAGPADALAPALFRMHVFHLDAIMLSHLHNDHYGGVSDLPGAVSCGDIVLHEGSAHHVPSDLENAADELGLDSFEEVRCGDVVSFGHFTISVLAPFEEVDGLENEDSQFLLVTYDDGRRTMSALLTGDGESEELEKVLARYGLSGIDILKVGHHGSSDSITAVQAERISPSFALCSAGYGNEFGHPQHDTVQALEESGAEFLCTIDEGDIVMAPSADGACRKG